MSLRSISAYLVSSRILWVFLAVVALLRLISLSLYPLMDPTEARYGEISRIMVETGDWIMPQIDYGVPFWGKPPLSFWASAVSISVFTNSEFFMRLPHVLAGIAVLLLIWQFVLALNFNRREAQITVAIIATTIGFLVTSGAVMTDMFLCLSMTMTMVGFWRGWNGEKLYVYLMYTGLGTGLLVKGPIIVVLTGLVLLPWILSTCGFRQMWKQVFLRLHPLSGILLTLHIALPWYVLAEQASPGFLNYFIIGEHFQRFIDSGWQGDLYGSGHAQTRGTIWLFWLVFALPWSPLLLIRGIMSIQRTRSLIPRDSLVLFALLWMCSPMLLFTLAGNILPAYIVPGLPALGLLMLKSRRTELSYKSQYLLFIGPVMWLALNLYIIGIASDKYNDKELLAKGITSKDDLYYLRKRTLSAQYYSNGRARVTDSFPSRERFYLVIDKRYKLDAINDYCQPRSSNERHQLFFCQRSKTSLSQLIQ